MHCFSSSIFFMGEAAKTLDYQECLVSFRAALWWVLHQCKGMHCFYSLSQKTPCFGGSGAESSEITPRLLPQTRPWGYFKLVELWAVWTIPLKKEGQNVVIKELCSRCALFCPWVKSLATSWDLRLVKGQGMWELPREGNYSQVTLCFNFSYFYLFSQDFQPGASLSVREASEWMRRCQHCCR